jgi:hypothetical protein
MKRRNVLSAALLLAAGTPLVHACGTCVEDKVAATYDHAVLQRAAAASRSVVYCEIEGQWDRARLEAAARRIRGVDASSLRFSREPAALSFAVDTRQQPVQAAAMAIQLAAPAGTQVRVIRISRP